MARKTTDSKVEQLIIESKIALLRAFPFMSFLVMSTRYIETDDLPTMGATVIRGTPTVFYNPEFTAKTLKNEAQRSFVIAHEILHIFLMHMGRQISNNYNHKLWNIATDYCINSHLIELKSNKIEAPEISFLYDEKYKDLSADEIYHKLLEENDGDIEKALDQYGDCGDGKMSPLDEVSAEEMTPDEQAQLKAQLAASLNNANVKEMGDGAASLYRKLRELIDPKVDWRTVLREYITSTSKYRYTFTKYNRRSTNVIFPSLTGDFLNIAVGVDTSGSMGQRELTEALTELKGIVDNFDSWNLSLLSCDTKGHLIGDYNTENGDDFSTISMDLIGGGGTDMNPMVEMVEEFEEQPAVLVIITDGYIPTLYGSTTIPTIVLVVSTGQVKFESTNIEKVIQID